MKRSRRIPVLALALLGTALLFAVGVAQARSTSEFGGSPGPAFVPSQPPGSDGAVGLTPVAGDAPVAPEAIVWSDNFDSYATGSQMHGQGGWKGWDNVPAAGALTSSTQARSAPNSVAILGASDLVHEYSGANTGQFAYIAWQFIPAAMTGQSYFILVNTYADGGPYNWSVQVRFDAALNQVVNEGSTVGTLPLVRDQWVQIRVEIDLGANTQTFFYNNQILYQGSWTEEVSGSGAANIAAVDLFANGASTIYYDDMLLASGGAQISLAKTVGTVSGACAATSAITVPAGTPVTYCYTVTNTGSTTLGTHDLVDSELGSLLAAFPYQLGPGASAYLTVDDVVLAGTTTNVATWTAYNVGGASAQAVGTATVTVEATGSVLEIPTLSVFGFALLALALAALGWMLLRRRSA